MTNSVLISTPHLTVRAYFFRRNYQSRIAKRNLLTESFNKYPPLLSSDPPPFEVQVHSPSFIISSAQFLRGTVYAKYVSL